MNVLCALIRGGCMTIDLFCVSVGLLGCSFVSLVGFLLRKKKRKDNPNHEYNLKKLVWESPVAGETYVLGQRFFPTLFCGARIEVTEQDVPFIVLCKYNKCVICTKFLKEHRNCPMFLIKEKKKEVEC